MPNAKSPYKFKRLATDRQPVLAPFPVLGFRTMANISTECWAAYEKCMTRARDAVWKVCTDGCLNAFSDPPNPDAMRACLNGCHPVAQAAYDVCAKELDGCVGRDPREKQRYEEQQKRIFNADGTVAIASGGLVATIGVGMLFATAPAWYRWAGLGTAALGTGLIIYASYQIAKAIDPIDNNFKSLARPRPPKPFVVKAKPGTLIDADVATAMNAVLENQAQVIGLDRAVMTSVNRAQGAAAANARTYEKLQMKNARRYAGEVVTVLRQSAGLRSRAASKLRENGAVFSVTEEEAFDIRGTSVEKGLPANILSRYCEDADEKEEVLLRFLSQLADAHQLEVTFPDVLSSATLASAEKRIAAALEEFSKSTYVRL